MKRFIYWLCSLNSFTDSVSEWISKNLCKRKAYRDGVEGVAYPIFGTDRYYFKPNEMPFIYSVEKAELIFK